MLYRYSRCRYQSINFFCGWLGTANVPKLGLLAVPIRVNKSYGTRFARFPQQTKPAAEKTSQRPVLGKKRIGSPVYVDTRNSNPATMDPIMPVSPGSACKAGYIPASSLVWDTVISPDFIFSILSLTMSLTSCGMMSSKEW